MYTTRVKRMWRNRAKLCRKYGHQHDKNGVCPCGHLTAKGRAYAMKNKLLMRGKRLLRVAK